MGYYFMPVRAEYVPAGDDWVCWSTYVDSPVARGTRDELTAWWRELFGTEGLRSLELQSPFDRGDEYGSSSSGGDGRWGTTLSVSGFGILGGGQLDRDKLPEFVAAVFPRDLGEAEGNGRGHAEVGRAVRALVTPFDPAEDPEIDPAVWAVQAEQAIADFESGYGRDDE